MRTRTADHDFPGPGLFPLIPQQPVVVAVLLPSSTMVAATAVHVRSLWIEPHGSKPTDSRPRRCILQVTLFPLHRDLRDSL